jgi:hypothetical protein
MGDLTQRTCIVCKQGFEPGSNRAQVCQREECQALRAFVNERCRVLRERAESGRYCAFCDEPPAEGSKYCASHLWRGECRCGCKRMVRRVEMGRQPKYATRLCRQRAYDQRKREDERRSALVHLAEEAA